MKGAVSHIKVTGVLAGRSSIIIKGGSYNYSYSFVEAFGGIAIQNGSILVIERGSFRVQPSLLKTLPACILSIGNSVQVEGMGSTLSISNNNITVFNAQVAVDWNTNLIALDLGTINFLNVFSIGTNGTLLVTNNIMTVSNLSVGRSWNVHTLSTKNSLSIGANGSLLVTNNNVVVSDVTVVSWTMYTMYLDSYIRIYISIGSNGIVLVANNNMVVSDVLVDFKWDFYTIYSPNLSITANGTLQVTNNTNEVSNFRARVWFVGTIFADGFTTSYLSIATNGTLSIVNNTMLVSNIGVYVMVYVDTISTSNLSIANGTLSITNDTMIVSNITVDKVWDAYSFWSVNTISTSTLAIGFNGTLLISKNIVSTAEYVLAGRARGWARKLLVSGYANVSGKLSVDDNVMTVKENVTLVDLGGLVGPGTVFLLRNLVSGWGSMIGVSGNDSDVSINTCSNYVGAMECYSTISSLGTNDTSYLCATGSGLRINDCELRTTTTTTTTAPTTTTTAAPTTTTTTTASTTTTTTAAPTTTTTAPTTTTTTTAPGNTTTTPPPYNAASPSSDGASTTAIVGGAVGGFALVIATVVGGTIAFIKYRGKPSVYVDNNDQLPLYESRGQDSVLNDTHMSDIIEGNLDSDLL